MLGIVSARQLFCFRKEMNCKPGYVSNGHLSSPAVAGRLKQPTRTVPPVSRKPAGRRSVLFGLASDGVYMCPARYRTGGGLLHRLCTLTGLPAGGCFLLHFPGSRLHRTLSGILPCEARTFLTCSLSSLQPRPSVHLRDVLYHKPFPPARSVFIPCRSRRR